MGNFLLKVRAVFARIFRLASAKMANPCMHYVYKTLLGAMINRPYSCILSRTVNMDFSMLTNVNFVFTAPAAFTIFYIT